MDFIGDVVEHDVSPPIDPVFVPQGKNTGFPKPKKISAFKSRTQRAELPLVKPDLEKNGYEVDLKTGLKRLPKEKQKLNYSKLSEAERIHLENIEILNSMSEEEKVREKEEMLSSMDPNVLKALLLRSEKKLAKKSEAEFEGYGDWIGGDKNGNNSLPFLDKQMVDKALGIKSLNKEDFTKNTSQLNSKNVSFQESVKWKHAEPEATSGADDLDLDDIAPPSYQINQQAAQVPFEEAILNVHFPKPVASSEEDYKIDLNDPEFQHKLYEKYFSDLPKDTSKLRWMEPVPDIDLKTLIFEDISELRFDFKGDLIAPAANASINTYEGLHHHSDSPALAGYTLKELAHLSRSTVPSQRSIAIRTIGRILHKLGKGKYRIVPEFEDEEGATVQPTDEAIKNTNTEFDQKLWGLIDELRVIETLQESADERQTFNVSVQNYAIEALWLWKEAGGNKRHAN